VDNSSTISREEFLKAIDSYDKDNTLSDNEKILILLTADQDRSNSINFNEFLALIQD